MTTVCQSLLSVGGRSATQVGGSVCGILYGGKPVPRKILK